jgi:hypothetical protein
MIWRAINLERKKRIEVVRRARASEHVINSALDREKKEKKRIKERAACN